MSRESDGNNAFKIELDSSPAGFEREQSLASKFDPISPTDLVNETMGQSPLAIEGEVAQPLVFEITEAVQELVNEVKQGKKPVVNPNPSGQPVVLPRSAEITIAAMSDTSTALEMTGVGFSNAPESFQGARKEKEVTPVPIPSVSLVPPVNPSRPISMTPIPEASAVPVVPRFEVEPVNLQATYESLCELILCQNPFDELVEKILEAMISSVGADSGSILELDHDSEELFFRASKGGAEANQLKTFRIPAASGIAGKAIENGSCIVLNNLQAESNQMTSVGLATGFQPNACLAAPIFIDDRLFGVVEIFSTRIETTFSEESVKAMNRIVPIVSKILEERFLIADLLGRKIK